MSDNNMIDSVVNPVVIIDNHEQGRLRCLMNLSVIDPLMSGPDMWGGNLFDLALNIATVYAQVNNHNTVDICNSIIQKMMHEAALWRDDPSYSAPKITAIVTGKPRLN